MPGVDPLDIILRVVDEEALRRLQAYGQFARQVIQGINQAEQQASRDSQQVDKERDFNLRQTAQRAAADRKALIKKTNDEIKASLKELSDFEKRMYDASRSFLETWRESDKKVLKAQSDDRKKAQQEVVRLTQQAAAEIEAIEKGFAAHREAIRDSERKAIQNQKAEQARISKETAAQQEKDDKAYLDAVGKDLAARKKLEADRARESVANTRAMIAEQKAELDAAFEEGKQLAQEKAAAEKKSEADVAASVKAGVKLRKIEHDREFRERMEQIRQRVNRTGGASAEEIRDFEEATKKKRALYRQQYLDGKVGAEDLLRFEREASEERDALMGKEKSAIMSIANAYTYMRAQAMVVQFLKELWVSYGRAVKEARDHVNGMVQDTEQFVVAHREHFAMRGEQATPMAARELAMRASRAALGVDEYAEAEKQFGNYAQQFIDDKAEEGGQLEPGKKFSRSQADRLMGQAATYGVGHMGLSPEESMKAFGVVAATGRPGASDQEILGNYAKLLKAAQNATGETAPEIGQMAKEAMEQLGPNASQQDLLDVIALGRQMSVGHPGSGNTYVRGIARGIRQMEAKARDERLKKGRSRLDELGIKPGASPREFMRQFFARAQEVRNRAVARGEDPDAAMRQFTAKYFDQEHEFQGAMATMNVGELGGGFARVDAEMAGVNAATLADANRVYRQGYAGQLLGEQSEEQAATFERGGNYSYLQHLRRQARIAIIQGGTMEIPDSLQEAFVRNGASAIPGLDESRAKQEEDKIVQQRISRFFMEHRSNPRAREYMKSRGIEFAYDPKNNNVPWYRRNINPFWNFEDQNLYGGMTSPGELGQGANLMKQLIDEMKKQTAIMEKEQDKAGAPVGNPGVPPAMGVARPPQQVNAGRP